MDMRILCYGDSNTYGCIGRWSDSEPTGGRYDADHRWPAVMGKTLGEGYHVIEGGFNGRSTIYDDPSAYGRNGETTMVHSLAENAPLDLVCILLGTNDLVRNKTITEDELPTGILRLIGIIRQHPEYGREGACPKILLMAPTEVVPSDPKGRTGVYAKFRGDIGRALSHRFKDVYSKIAKEQGCYFLNAADYAHPGPADGIHLDPDSQVNLGKAMAKYVSETVAPNMRESAGIRHYMTFHRPLRSAQGMDIYGDKAFILYDKGYCGVYDLRNKQSYPIDFFPLGSCNEGTPDRNYLNHANSCMFGNLHRNGNPLPLLYVTAGTGIGYDADGYYYRCAVEDITKDAEGRYHSELVQTITYSPEAEVKAPFVNPCWGCPAFFADTDKGYLYIFSARYRTKRGCTPEGEHNAYIITKFALPDVSQGGLVKLTAADILDQFSVESDVPFTQGGMLFKNRIYYTYGCPKADYPVAIQVFDLEKKTLEVERTDLSAAFYGQEIECLGVYQGEILCNTCVGSLFAVPFGALEEDLCTMK